MAAQEYTENHDISLMSDTELVQGCCSSPASQHSPSNRPPDGGYGWICVISCFLVNCFTWGVVAVRERNPKYLSWYELLTFRAFPELWGVFRKISIGLYLSRGYTSWLRDYRRTQLLNGHGCCTSSQRGFSKIPYADPYAFWHSSLGYGVCICVFC